MALATATALRAYYESDEAREARDHDIQWARAGRLVTSAPVVGRTAMPMTRGWSNRVSYEEVVGPDGKPVRVTTIGATLYRFVAWKFGTAGGHMAVREIARQSGLTRSSVSAWLPRLTRLGLIYADTILAGRRSFSSLGLRRAGDGLERLRAEAWRQWRELRARAFERLVARLRAVFAKCPDRNQTAGEELPVDSAGSYYSLYLDISGVERERRRRELQEALADGLHLDPSRHRGRVPCPAHGEHRKLTLSWWWREDGTLGVKCWAGCTFAEIRAALGL